MNIEFQKPKNRCAPSTLVRCWLPAAVAALVLWSCLAAAPSGDPSGGPLPIETVWAGNQCGCEERQPLVRWVTDRDQFTVAVAAARSTALDTQSAHHPVDWKRDGMVWIDMGLKPSGGYALSLAAPTATISAGVVVITVRWRHPRPGSVVTQQLTSPCLLLKLVRGNFHTIRINDEAGRVRATLKVGKK